VLPGAVYEKIYVGRTVEVDAEVILNLIDKRDTYNSVELKDALMRIVYMERTMMAVKGS